MPCSEWENQLYEYIDGELPPPAVERLERHLEKCAHCRELLAQLREENEQLENAFDFEHTAPNVVADRVMAQVAGRKRRARWPWFAAIAASLILGFILIRPESGLEVARIMNRSGLTVPGGVTVMHKGLPIEAEAGLALAAGDIVRTDADRVVFLRRPSGDEIVLNSESSITLSAERLVEMNKGESFVHVTPGRGGFTVRTPAGDAEVVGTQFSVSYNPVKNSASLTVVEGKVRFGNAISKKLVMGGNRSTVVAGAAPSAPTAVNARALTAWVHPPTPADLEAVAGKLRRNLRATIKPAQAVYKPDEPITVAVELANVGSESVLFSSALFVDRQDTAVVRARPELSQVMLTRISGTDLAEKDQPLPQPELREIRPGELWVVEIDLQNPESLPALRAIAGPGAFSIAASIAAAEKVPGAPDGGIVWTDIRSESAIIRIIGNMRPREGKAVAGLQLGLDSETPACRLGDPIALQFSLKGVSGDQLAVNARGDFQLKIEPETFGSLATFKRADLWLPLKKTVPDGRIDHRPQNILPMVGINMLADASALPQNAGLAAGMPFIDALERFGDRNGAEIKTGRSAVWIVPNRNRDAADVSAALEDFHSDWIKLQAVQTKSSELVLPTGGDHFQLPGLYRCTLEYSNESAKEGPDWAAAWLGSVQSPSVIVAVLEPPAAQAVTDNHLSAKLEFAGRGEQGDTVRLKLTLKNSAAEGLAVDLKQGLEVRHDRIFRDLLNADCYEDVPREFLEVLDRQITIMTGGITAIDLLNRDEFAPLGEIAGIDRLKDRKFVISARRVTLGEVLEFVAKSADVAFTYNGTSIAITARDVLVPKAERLQPTLINDEEGQVAVPANGAKEVELAVHVQLQPQAENRLQASIVNTGQTSEGARLWTGSIRSNIVVVPNKEK